MTRMFRSWFLVVLISGFFQGVPVIAQATEQRPCRAALSDFSWMLEGDGQYFHLNSDRSGKKLHGLTCREADIVDWFEGNSWTHLKTASPDGTSFGHGARRYQADRILVFCLPRRFPFRWRTNGCFAQASVSLFDGRITNLTAGPSI